MSATRSSKQPSILEQLDDTRQEVIEAMKRIQAELAKIQEQLDRIGSL